MTCTNLHSFVYSLCVFCLAWTKWIFKCAVVIKFITKIEINQSFLNSPLECDDDP